MQMIMVVEEKEKEKEFTTIRITKQTRSELDRLGDIHEENYEDIVQRLIRHNKILERLHYELEKMENTAGYEKIGQKLLQFYVKV